jgi:hypothetical protein
MEAGEPAPLYSIGTRLEDQRRVGVLTNARRHRQPCGQKGCLWDRRVVRRRRGWRQEGVQGITKLPVDTRPVDARPRPVVDVADTIRGHDVPRPDKERPANDGPVI